MAASTGTRWWSTRSSRAGRSLSTAMSAGEELVREVWERWNKGARDVDPVLFDPEIEIHSALTRSVFRGADGVSAWSAEIDQQFEQWEVSALEMEAVSDERVLVHGTIKARGRGSGMDLDQPASWIVEIRDGRVRRIHNFIGHDAAQAAIAELDREPAT
jgi:ketosteroid isomerase-like protein